MAHTDKGGSPVGDDLFVTSSRPLLRSDVEAQSGKETLEPHPAQKQPLGVAAG